MYAYFTVYSTICNAKGGIVLIIVTILLPPVLWAYNSSLNGVSNITSYLSEQVSKCVLNKVI